MELNEFVAGDKIRVKDLPAFSSELTENEFLKDFKDAWNQAVPEIEKEIKVSIKEDVLIRIGNELRPKAFSYGNRIKFTRSVIIIGILNYLNQTKGKDIHLWWDEFEKINSYDISSKLNIVKKYIKKYVSQIDYKKAIESIQSSGTRSPRWSAGKARAYFASLLQNRDIQKPVKKQSEKIIGSQLGSMYSFLGSSIEQSVKKFFDENGVKYTQHPNNASQFPDFEIRSNGYKFFSVLKPGDYLEVKSKSITPTKRGAKRIEGVFNASNGILDSEELNKNKIKSLQFFGLSGPRDLYFFMKAGKSNSFSLYKMKTDFNKGKFLGKFNLNTGKGNLRYIIPSLDLAVKFFQFGKLFGFNKPDHFKDRGMELVKSIDAKELSRQMGIMQKHKGEVSSKQEINIRQARQGGEGYSVAQESKKLKNWIAENV